MVAYLKKTEGSEGFHKIVYLLNTSHIRYALTENPIIYVFNSFGKLLLHLKLENSDGISNLPTTKFFEQLALMGSPPHTNVADEAASTYVNIRYGGVATTITSLEVGQGSGNIDKTPTMPHDSPLPRVHILGSDEGRMQQNELIDLVTKLSDRVVALETNLTQTKKVYGATFTKLIKKVKRLEKKDKISKSKRKLRLVLSDKEGSDLDILAQEDPSKQGRKIAQINKDEGITLVQMGVSTASTDFTIASVPVTTAGAEISTARPEVKTAGDSVDDIAAESLVYIRRSAAKTKDKEQLNEEERQRIAKAHEAVRSFNIEEWEDIQAKIEADEELAHRLQAEEREKYSEAEKARLLTGLINQRKRHFSQQRAEERRNKPPTQAQQRTYISNYIKHMGSYTLQQLRGYSFYEIKSLFESTMKRVNTFTLMESDVDRTIPKIADGSTKRAAEEELGQQSSKKQKLDELSQEELQLLMIIVPEEGMNIEALQTKYLIIDWEVYTEDSRMYWKIIRVGNHTEVELKRLFEPDADDELWKSQKHIHDITWRLCACVYLRDSSTLNMCSVLDEKEETNLFWQFGVILFLQQYVLWSQQDVRNYKGYQDAAYGQSLNMLPVSNKEIAGSDIIKRQNNQAKNDKTDVPSWERKELCKNQANLPPEWNTHVVVWMNKAEIETMSINDLYNNFKIVEQSVKKSVGAILQSPNVNTASPQVSTASFSDNVVYAFMVENPNGSNLLQQDLEQIHEDDLEAIDLKWQLSLLSMRAKRYYQRTGKKIFINANDTVGYDKSKVECFNCHKMGHFARECRAPRNKEGFDWSDMAEEHVQTNMALIAFSDSEVYNDKTCLATVEEQLITYRKNRVLFSEEVVVLKREVACKDYEINVLKSEFEKVKQEKEGIEFKIEKFDKASKDLDKLLESQITDKSKKGLGYSIVPSHHPLIYNRPKKLDLSYSGLDEFKEPEFKRYGHEDRKKESNVVCDKKSDDYKENSDNSLVKEQVSKDTSSFVESSLNVDKETVFPVDKKGKPQQDDTSIFNYPEI
ncbi:retrovirus-related pol polyprotein from transposon TNT 1-94 [Tanacetum coccineum]